MKEQVQPAIVLGWYGGKLQAVLDFFCCLLLNP